MASRHTPVDTALPGSRRIAHSGTKLLDGVLLLGTTSIGRALWNSQDVIVGRVLSTRPAAFHGETSTPEGLATEVVKAIKGDLQGSIFIATMSMCCWTLTRAFSSLAKPTCYLLFHLAIGEAVPNPAPR